ncbi:MAG TPA: hypothetical protein DEV81_04040 [Cyanobacteria bacterium UBA11049]|nr:hypothetical protein [Cyanobacteria bacterium UBA11049]
MERSRILFEQLVSADGNVQAEAKSVTSVSGADEGTIHQTVVVKISQDGNSSSSSSSCSSSTAKRRD